MVPHTIKTLKCDCCKQVRPISKFDVHPQSKSGYRKTCKDCISIYHAKKGPKLRINNVQKPKKDQLAYHPNQTATLSPYYRKIIGGKIKPRDPNVTPPKTIRWSDSDYWMEKPIYTRQTDNKSIKSRGV